MDVALVEQRRTFNPLAIASLALSMPSLLLGFILAIPPVLAVVFGFVALGQIKRNPMLRGRGMAVAGVVIGMISSVWWIYLWTDLIAHNFYGH
jgi:hypothetical protein